MEMTLYDYMRRSLKANGARRRINAWHFNASSRWVLTELWEWL